VEEYVENSPELPTEDNDEAKEDDSFRVTVAELDRYTEAIKERTRTTVLAEENARKEYKPSWLDRHIRDLGEEEDYVGSGQWFKDIEKVAPPPAEPELSPAEQQEIADILSDAMDERLEYERRRDEFARAALLGTPFRPSQINYHSVKDNEALGAFVAVEDEKRAEKTIKRTTPRPRIFASVKPTTGTYSAQNPTLKMNADLDRAFEQNMDRALGVGTLGRDPYAALRGGTGPRRASIPFEIDLDSDDDDAFVRDFDCDVVELDRVASQIEKPKRVNIALKRDSTATTTRINDEPLTSGSGSPVSFIDVTFESPVIRSEAQWLWWLNRLTICSGRTLDEVFWSKRHERCGASRTVIARFSVSGISGGFFAGTVIPFDTVDRTSGGIAVKSVKSYATHKASQHSVRVDGKPNPLVTRLSRYKPFQKLLWWWEEVQLERELSRKKRKQLPYDNVRGVG
jgi:hypothetical protein